MNITDIDDKILNAAAEHKRDPLEGVKEKEKIYLELQKIKIDFIFLCLKI